MKICGIYKITSPSNKIYIGQSVDIARRFGEYQKLINCKFQVILYRSLLKYGSNRHKFEILCECNINELNHFERYYQDLYCVLNKNGMNCMLVKTCFERRVVSQETRDKISRSNTGKVSPKKGLKISKETKKKISIYQKNKSLEHRLKISQSRKGSKQSQEWINKRMATINNKKLKEAKNTEYNYFTGEDRRQSDS